MALGQNPVSAVQRRPFEFARFAGVMRWLFLPMFQLPERAQIAWSLAGGMDEGERRAARR